MDISVPSDFDEKQTALYCRMVRHMTENQATFCHPRMEPITASHWETIVHNAAFFAAHCLSENESLLHIVDLETDEPISLEKSQNQALN